ncbi:TPA: succinate dehydrogenase, cytochrome b556 subunit, partial [Klebsiella pneumoniae]|nr:succinate dehydrogenase, cytochrome b556 subunit [Klebsiella pneumoniae]
VGHTLKGSNRASTIVLVVSGVLMVAGAVWIW